MNTEDLLRDTLRKKAQDADDTVTFEEVRRAARLRRRHAGRRTAALAAAAVVVAVGAPTAFLLRPAGNEPAPAPSPSPTPSAPVEPSPSPTQPASPGVGALEAIPRGEDSHVVYLQGGVVHLPDGTTTTLPAAADDVTQFTPYHGGWLVVSSVGGLTEYDGSGAVVLRTTGGESALAVSADLMRTAFQVDDHVRVGISSGMGEGESRYPLPTYGGLVGFLGDRVLVRTPDGPRAIDDTGKESAVPGTSSLDVIATSSVLVGGFVGTGDDADLKGAVADTSTGKVLWRNDWAPLQFSADGRYLAAVPVADNGDPSAIAILDARTGEVVAKTPDNDDIGVSRTVAWDDDRVLFEAVGGEGSEQAVLALDTSGHLTRASDVYPLEPRQPEFVFATQP